MAPHFPFLPTSHHDHGQRNISFPAHCIKPPQLEREGGDLALAPRSLAYASSIGHSQRFQLSPPRPSPPISSPPLSLLIHPLAMDEPSFDKSGIPLLTVVDFVLKLEGLNMTPLYSNHSFPSGPGLRISCEF